MRLKTKQNENKSALTTLNFYYKENKMFCFLVYLEIFVENSLPRRLCDTHLEPSSYTSQEYIQVSIIYYVKYRFYGDYKI